MTEPVDHHGPETPASGEYANQTINLLMQRASLRSFSNKPIPEDVLQQILEAGAHAASGGNLQPWSVIKITSAETKRWLVELDGQGFIAAAPVSLLFCLDFHRLQRLAELETAPFTANRSFRHFWVGCEDTLIAAQSMCTAADALGLGSVYLGTVSEYIPQLRERLKLPQGVFPLVLVCFGYPKKAPALRKKYPADVLVHDETYQELPDAALLAAMREKYGNRNFQITPERLENIETVCRQVEGPEFAEKCLARIRQDGFINPIIHYFGLHYVASEMPLNNLDFLQTLRDSGFFWMDEYSNRSEETPGEVKA